MEQEKMRHEIVTSNPDVDVRFYLSKDEGSYVSPHSSFLSVFVPPAVRMTSCA